MKKESFGAGATLMKTKSSEAGAIFMKRSPDPELCHFYVGSVAVDSTSVAAADVNIRFDVLREIFHV